MTTMSEHVAQIRNSLEQILVAFTPSPSATVFLDNFEALIQLEEAFNIKALIDISATKAAELAEAGNLVGSSRHVDFLIEKLRLSRAEAFTRIRLAEEFFGNPDPELDDENDQDKDRRKELAKHVRKEAFDVAHNAPISAEKLSVINKELSNLNALTSPTRSELLKSSVAEAAFRSVEDLRKWARTEVISANKTSPEPFAAARKRFLTLYPQDSDGGVTIRGYLTATDAAVLVTSLAQLSKRGDLIDAPADQDIRTLGQRRADGFSHIIRSFCSEKSATSSSGVGTIVVSMTVDDINDLEKNGPGHRYPSNAGIQLSPFDILELGAARYDFGAILDSESGRPLYLGRTQRSASLNQHLALLASELVCSAPGCTEPAINCEIHHMNPWGSGGSTDIDNLTGLCFKDHPKNDDSRSGANNKGYMDVDPQSGRAARFPADGSRPEFNDSAHQAQSGGARARRKHQQSQLPISADCTTANKKAG